MNPFTAALMWLLLLLQPLEIGSEWHRAQVRDVLRDHEEGSKGGGGEKEGSQGGAGSLSGAFEADFHLARLISGDRSDLEAF